VGHFVAHETEHVFGRSYIAIGEEGSRRFTDVFVFGLDQFVRRKIGLERESRLQINHDDDPR
jgi:hypothetical protein